MKISNSKSLLYRIKPFTSYFLIMLLASLLYAGLTNPHVRSTQNHQIPPNTSYDIPVGDQYATILAGRTIKIEISTDHPIHVIFETQTQIKYNLIIQFNRTISSKFSFVLHVQFEIQSNLRVVSDQITNIQVFNEVSGISYFDTTLLSILLVLFLLSFLIEYFPRRVDRASDKLAQIETNPSLLQQIWFILKTEINSYLVLPLFFPILMIRSIYSNASLGIGNYSSLMRHYGSKHLIDYQFYFETRLFLYTFLVYSFISLPIIYSMRNFEMDGVKYNNITLLPISKFVRWVTETMLFWIFSIIPVLIIALVFVYTNLFNPEVTINYGILTLSLSYSAFCTLIIAMFYFLFHELFNSKYLRFLVQFILFVLSLETRAFLSLFGINGTNLSDLTGKLPINAGYSGSLIIQIVPGTVLSFIGLLVCSFLIVKNASKVKLYRSITNLLRK